MNKNPKVMGADMSGDAADWHPRLPIYRLYWKNTQDLINNITKHVHRGGPRAKRPYLQWFEWTDTGSAIVLWLIGSRGDRDEPLEVMVFPSAGCPDNRQIIKWIRSHGFAVGPGAIKRATANRVLHAYEALGVVYDWPDINEWIKADPTTWGFAMETRSDMFQQGGPFGYRSHRPVKDFDKEYAIITDAIEMRRVMESAIEFKEPTKDWYSQYSLIVKPDESGLNFKEIWIVEGKSPKPDNYAWPVRKGYRMKVARNPDRWYCHVRDLDRPDADYVAYGPEDAHSAADASAIRECQKSNDVITMGHTIVYPAEHSQQVANTILQQLGGNKFLAMTGARNLVAICDGLMFGLPRGARNGVNKVKIVYTAMDLYDVEFGKIKDCEYHIIEQYEGVTFDQLQPLFTEATGLDTHL